jgi:hypothetical protein
LWYCGTRSKLVLRTSSPLKQPTIQYVDITKPLYINGGKITHLVVVSPFGAQSPSLCAPPHGAHA